MAKEKGEKRNYVAMIAGNIVLSVFSSYILTVFVTAILISLGFELESAKNIFLVILGFLFILLTLKSFYGINIL